ncbi:hypothetical protein AMES_3440 [Amycolatopsis mediterranei S699]|uniref:Secreted protein n=1 Tax=Amycolatopsis mediterranei (strain U-32) TaxID=749927 RepID=A0A0H3D2U4_AMYMU|nr:hypothetical protein [Amycolatopsis mediterranei]ADJ45265.1 hypothetical protein AMED_3479 [Amycolatopsis mediterranei U32]AFO76976.1 hypothetical protein AMES_3440 [Amycolatopsis mediterranei S699]AGT84104.1 hypothetical protein B737_3440 [Amycolatopsis mediterranei RB]KDO08550.1 hypothetical protein DV26_22770 [Amycolatopsis mediterranei]KDU89095.1 hypothetical protein DV36_26690 [Amycolatopsis mediterranei]
MRRRSAVPGALLLVLSAVACGNNARPGSADALCSASYEPRELVDSGPLYPPLPAAAEGTRGENRSTDAAAIKKVAAAVCGLPEPPPDVVCTAELGPSYRLRFVDTAGRTTTLTAAAYGCQFVRGLGTERVDARPLWAALTAAGLPTPPVR